MKTENKIKEKEKRMRREFTGTAASGIFRKKEK
jgi:hypothetical protein